MAMLSVIILTHNEEANLPFALESLAPLDARVFIVDSGSTDRTVEIAGRFGCTVASHKWVNYADQLNWAIQNLPFDTPWVMRLDADERLTPELVEELRTKLVQAPENVGGFLLKRRVYFWGKWIKHGGYYPTWLLRIWRRGDAQCEARWMDEHMVLSRGSIERLEHDIIDENHKGLSFWVDKHNRYADREVRDLLESQAENPAIADQAGRRRWLKMNLYARAPLFYRAYAYWMFRYFIKMGFLDGREGLVFHTLQGLWYRLLVDAKFQERIRREQSTRES